ncbi:MAG TPA: hypothetical protein VGH29_04005, partial [Candidatus Binataceae bacterium]
PCPTAANGIPIVPCGTPSAAGPFLQDISICPGTPLPPTPVSTSTAVDSTTPMETTCPKPFVTAVPAGGMAQFHAVGTFSDGSTQDVTDSASTSWTSTNNAVISPNSSPAGSYSVVGSGCAMANANSGGISGSPPAEVEVPPASCPTPAADPFGP